MNRLQRMFLAAPDSYIRERVVDLYDIEKRVLRHILGRAREDITKLSEAVVVVAHDMTPSQAAGLDTEHVLGFAIDVGGQTSHTSIIARMLGIPAIVGLNNITSDISGGETLIIDGTHGTTVCNPDQENIRRYRERAVEYGKFQRSLEVLRDLPSVTRDGTSIHLYANIELPEETRVAMQTGAEGVGLYRSEFLFIANEVLPTEEEQYQTLRGSVRHAHGSPFVIRTADFGADKHIPSIKQESEANPFLGMRSIRLCLSDLNMFQTHLRAILRASAEGDVWIMFPMLTTLMELRQAKSVMQDVMEDLDEREIPYRRDLPIGMMVETPAAALMSSAFAKEVDFMSIGTNDLTQYTLAVDRGNENVAYLYTPHSPPVLRLVRQVIRAGEGSRVDVNLCGEMAGNVLYTQLLIGLGLRKLSMAPKNIPLIKKIIRLTTIEECQAVARKVMRSDSERQIASVMRERLRRIDPEAI
jgi:phosphotransferase system enzyme I (PtsI)